MASTARGEELAVLFREHYPALRRLALAMTSDRHLAEELAQESFVRAWRALDRMRGDTEAAGAYLRTTLVNLVRRSFRRRMLEMRQQPRTPRGADADHAERIALVQAVRKLPPRQRACIALRYLEDRSEQDTARILGVSVGTVKSQTHKALERLGKIIGGRDGSS